MKTKPYSSQDGSALICALCTILIISLIGANVLLNCTTRYNVSSKQVKGWKEALYAAEGGGDIAFSVLHTKVPKDTTDLPTTFAGWQPSPSGSSYSNGPYTFGQKLADGTGSLKTNVTVDQLAATLNGQQVMYFRIRSQGTATLFGLPRVGMDDRMDNVTKGDSLLRKIDFKYDHFLAKYGDGDSTLGTLKIQSVPIDPQTHQPIPQITRRIETIAVPQLASFTGALMVGNAFAGPGHAGVVDSYDSKNGAYTFVADKPSSPFYADSQNGNVSVGTGSFSEWGPIYGNVTTNGGNVTRSGTSISGTIDNSVPFSIPTLANPWSPTASGWISSSPATIALPSSATSQLTPTQYVYSSLTSGVTINPYVDPATNVAQETYVKIVVNGDVGGNITIGNHVNAQIYFTGNLNLKISQVLNYNVDNGVPTNPSRAGHLQFYGISPTGGSTQTVNITPPGDLYATLYAPNANVTLTGNANWYGAIVASTFTGNGNGGGNTAFHYDKEIAQLVGVVTDYRIASYIEDIR